MRYVKSLLATASALAVSASVNAATVLPTDPTTLTADLNADISAIGPVIIAVAAAVMGLRWIKAMFF